MQRLNEPRLGYITDQLKSLAVSGSAPPQLQAGSLCLAQYSLDNEWYRASVQRGVSNDPVNPQYAVIFLDFGNTDRVGGKNIRPIDSALAAVPAQAHLCTLSHLKVPSLPVRTVVFKSLLILVVCHAQKCKQLKELALTAVPAQAHLCTLFHLKVVALPACRKRTSWLVTF